MLRISLMSLWIVVTMFLTCTIGQKDQTTTWEGSLDANGTELRLEVSITDRDGNLTGEMISIDQDNAKLKMSGIKSDDNTLSFSIRQIGGKFNGKYENDQTIAKGTFSQSGMELPLTLTKTETKAATPKPAESKETLREAWIGKLKMGVMEPVMQFRIVTTESGETKAYFDSVTEGRTDFESAWSIVDDKLQFEIPNIELKYAGTLNEARDEAEGTWNQGGRSLPLTLKKHTTEYENSNVWENRPQRPVAPFPYDAEEVTFENSEDNVTLAGTLTIPKKQGKHPAVILISGSGPQDRDESLMEHKPFLVLADYLSRRGIAVLRYDDRGTASSTGNFGNATTEDFARDASAAVEFLTRHDRINPKEIGLAGHSEGGVIAPMTVGLRDDVAFVVLLAATGVDGATISTSQVEAMLRASGAEEFVVQIELAVSRAAINIAKNAKAGEDVSDELNRAIDAVIETIPESEREEGGKRILAAINMQKAQLQSPWMRFFLSYDPRPALADISCPVLAIVGSKDLQVVPDINMPEIKKALEQGGNKDFETMELDGLNHLFQKCETGAVGEYAVIQETFNPVALKKIGDWIVEHTTAANK